MTSCSTWRATTISAWPGIRVVVQAGCDALVDVGCRVDRFSTGHRFDRAARVVRGRLGCAHGLSGRTDLLLRLPGQPRRRHRAGRRRRPGRVRRGQPRLRDRRLPTVPGAGRGDAASVGSRCGSRHSRPVRKPEHSSSPTRCSPSTVTSRPLAELLRRLPGRTVPCWSSTKRTPSASSGDLGRGAAFAGRPGRAPGRRAHRDLVQGPRAARAAPSWRSRRVIDHLVDAARSLHLRHRPGTRLRRLGRGGTRPGSQGLSARRRRRGPTPSCWPRPPASSGSRRPAPAAAVVPVVIGEPIGGRWRAQAICAEHGSGSAASGRRRCPTAAPGSGSPRAPISPTTQLATVRSALQAVADHIAPGRNRGDSA